MPDFIITKARNAGEKDNPHGGKLVKWYIGLQDAPSGVEDVYVQKKPGNDLSPGMEISGRLEKGEYGWRLFPEPQQGNFQRPAYKVEGTQAPLSKDQYWTRRDERDVESQARQGRAHAQEMALREQANLIAAEVAGMDDYPLLKRIDFYHQDVQRFPLDADVGSGQAAHGASEPRPPVDEDAVDLSAGADVGGGSAGLGLSPNEGSAADVSPEASRAQKGKLTQMFHAAGLSRDAMKAVVLFRCGSEKATKQGASQLITDLQEGATHDALLAEIWDAKRAGNPLGARAAALIPTEVPMDTEGLPGDDGSLPEVPQKDEENVPF